MSEPPPVPLLDRARLKIRLKHYSLRTEQAYLDWIKRYIIFHGKRHPAEMGAGEVEAFLTHLAAARNVAASTQNQGRTRCCSSTRNSWPSSCRGSIGSSRPGCLRVCRSC
jgi:hypothetical protein